MGARFSTVLGNGADAYHESHVHLDLMEKGNHNKICQWDVLDPAETAALEAKKAAASAPAYPAGTRKASDVPLHAHAQCLTPMSKLWGHRRAANL